jgi:hypothetical protein
MKDLILVKLYDNNNEVIYVQKVQNLSTAYANLAADLDGWDEDANYGTAELIVFLNIKQYKEREVA